MKRAIILLIMVSLYSNTATAQNVACENSIVDKNIVALVQGDFSVYPMPVSQIGEFHVKLLKSFTDLTLIHINIRGSKGEILDRDYQVENGEVLIKMDNFIAQGDYTIVVYDPKKGAGSGNRHRFIVY